MLYNQQELVTLAEYQKQKEIDAARLMANKDITEVRSTANKEIKETQSLANLAIAQVKNKIDDARALADSRVKTLELETSLFQQEAGILVKNAENQTLLAGQTV